MEQLWGTTDNMLGRACTKSRFAFFRVALGVPEAGRGHRQLGFTN